MTLLYNHISADDVFEYLNNDNDKIKDFLSEIIMTGQFEIYNKFILVPTIDLKLFFNSVDILKLLPMFSDVEIITHIMNTYEFENGLTFFYNYAMYNTSKEVKNVVYNYLVENYSHVILDNLQLYSKLID